MKLKQLLKEIVVNSPTKRLDLWSENSEDRKKPLSHIIKGIHNVGDVASTFNFEFNDGEPNHIEKHKIDQTYIFSRKGELVIDMEIYELSPEDRQDALDILKEKYQVKNPVIEEDEEDLYFNIYGSSIPIYLNDQLISEEPLADLLKK